MSEENQQISASDVGNMETAQGASPDLDWDFIEETAPAMPEAGAEASGETTDERNLDENQRSDETAIDGDSVEASESSGEELTEDSKEAGDKSEDTPGEDSSGEGESREENPQISEDAEIEVKVDGEVQKVSLKELKNNYSGKVAYDKRFTELDKERKQYKQEVDQVNKYVEDLGKTMQDAGILDGVKKIAELVGMKPHEAEKQLISQLIPEIQRLQGLSEQERDLEYKKKEIEYEKKTFESNQKKSETKQAQEALERKVSEIRETHNIDEQEWDKAFKVLDEQLPKEEAITPEKVQNAVLYFRADGRANSLLEGYDAKLIKNENVLNSVRDVMYSYPELSDTEVLDLVKQAQGLAKQQDAEEKVQKAASKKQPAQEEPKKTGPAPIQTNEGNEVTDWDDLIN